MAGQQGWIKSLWAVAPDFRPAYQGASASPGAPFSADRTCCVFLPGSASLCPTLVSRMSWEFRVKATWRPEGKWPQAQAALSAQGLFVFPSVAELFSDISSAKRDRSVAARGSPVKDEAGF